jgi:hypothetical protein
MTCKGCRANNLRLVQGYEWVSEKVSPMYKCTCKPLERFVDWIIDWTKLIFFRLVVSLILLAFVVFVLLLIFLISQILWGFL